MNVYIYGLVDPRDMRVRYIGKTIHLKLRFYQHMKADAKNPFKDEWINELALIGLKPEMKIIDRCDDFDWQSRERFWIAEYRKTTPDLTNIEDGGSGVEKSFRITSQQRECRVCREGTFLPDEICEHCDVMAPQIARDQKERYGLCASLVEIRERELGSILWEITSKNNP